MIFKVCCESINFLYFTPGQKHKLAMISVVTKFPIREHHWNAWQCKLRRRQGLAGVFLASDNPCMAEMWPLPVLSCSGGRLCESQDKPFSSHFPLILERLVGRRLHLKAHRIYSSSKLSWKSPPLSLSQWRSTFILSNLIKAKVGIYVYFTNVMQLENLTKSNWNKLCKEEQALDRQLLNWNIFHGFAWLCRRWWVTASERRSPATYLRNNGFYIYLIYEFNISYCIV